MWSLISNTNPGVSKVKQRAYAWRDYLFHIQNWINFDPIKMYTSA